MADRRSVASSRFPVLALLLYIITLSQDNRDEILTEIRHRELCFMPSCRLKAKSWTFLHRRPRVTAWKTVMNVSTRVKRSKATTAYYDNSTSAFRPILQLLHDVETNPGPALNYSTNGSGKTNGNVSIAHLNVRSLKCRDHYVLVKETVLTNRFDIFTVSETMARNSGHLSPHSICGLTTKIKMAKNTSRRRSRNVLDYSELNALSSVVLYNTSKRKKT